MQAYPEYAVKLGARYGKEVDKIQIIGGQKLVNPKIYHDFTQTLVHVFRNTVAHGIETIEERLEAGKEEKGKIQCEIIENQEGFIVRIADDGRGIDIDKIKKLAVTKNIIDQETAMKLSDEEARKLILADGFSSAAYADEIAGRGVGLYAVQKEVEKLGGRVEIESHVGMGTEFSFILPLLTAI